MTRIFWHILKMLQALVARVASRSESFRGPVQQAMAEYDPNLFASASAISP